VEVGRTVGRGAAQSGAWRVHVALGWELPVDTPGARGEDNIYLIAHALNKQSKLH